MASREEQACPPTRPDDRGFSVQDVWEPAYRESSSRSNSTAAPASWRTCKARPAAATTPQAELGKCNGRLEEIRNRWKWSRLGSSRQARRTMSAAAAEQTSHGVPLTSSPPRWTVHPISRPTRGFGTTMIGRGVTGFDPLEKLSVPPFGVIQERHHRGGAGPTAGVRRLSDDDRHRPHWLHPTASPITVGPRTIELVPRMQCRLPHAVECRHEEEQQPPPARTPVWQAAPASSPVYPSARLMGPHFPPFDPRPQAPSFHSGVDMERHPVVGFRPATSLGGDHVSGSRYGRGDGAPDWPNPRLAHSILQDALRNCYSSGHQENIEYGDDLDSIGTPVPSYRTKPRPFSPLPPLVPPAPVPSPVPNIDNPRRWGGSFGPGTSSRTDSGAMDGELSAGSFPVKNQELPSPPPLAGPSLVDETAESAVSSLSSSNRSSWQDHVILEDIRRHAPSGLDLHHPPAITAPPPPSIYHYNEEQHQQPPQGMGRPGSGSDLLHHHHRQPVPGPQPLPGPEPRRNPRPRPAPPPEITQPSPVPEHIQSHPPSSSSTSSSSSSSPSPPPYPPTLPSPHLPSRTPRFSCASEGDDDDDDDDVGTVLADLHVGGEAASATREEDNNAPPGGSYMPVWETVGSGSEFSLGSWAMVPDHVDMVAAVEPEPKPSPSPLLFARSRLYEWWTGRLY